MILLGVNKSKLKFFHKNKQNLFSFVALVLFIFTSANMISSNVAHSQDEAKAAEQEAEGAEKKAEGAEQEAKDAEKQAEGAEQEAKDAEKQAEDTAETPEQNQPVYSGPRDEDAIVSTTDVVSSRLKKMDLAGPAPEIRISSDEIFKSGRTSIADFLRDNPVTALGSDSETAGLSAGAGAAFVNLRGLGDSNTLVLLNGVRFPPMSGSDSVDVNRIPMAIVKEIIVVKDDLSSIYGSDAIGGVVNIITNQGFDGFQINAGRNWTTLAGRRRPPAR